MSQRLAHWASTALAGRSSSRRRFLTRAAVAGSALATVPGQWVLRPGSAYAAVCNCNGSSCDCSALCCDGYTEFCCQIHGANDCPPGTTVAGWWRAAGSGFCDVDGQARDRYYLDCNANCGPGCGCGGSGVCAQSCSSCAGRGGCANGDCNNRKACQTAFRYGQCNTDVACVGPIECRVVTCTPPWTIAKFDCDQFPTKTDNATRFHDRPCLHTSDPTDLPDTHGLPGILVTGDWTGQGVSLPGFYDDSNYFRLRRSLSSGQPEIVFQYGIPGDIPVTGDWDGSGRTGVGVVRDGQWFLSTDLGASHGNIYFRFGPAGARPIVGDWTGDGVTKPGFISGTTWTLALNPTGTRTVQFKYGLSGDVPIAGDWNGDGRWGPGIVRRGEWHLRNSTTTGPADQWFRYGNADDAPVVGDWDGDDIYEPGVVRRNTHAWLLSYQAGRSTADHEFQYPGEPDPGPHELIGRFLRV